MPKPSKKESKPKSIKRKVFFYRVNAGTETDTGQPRQVNFHPALQHLDNMPFTSDGRYLANDDGKQLCCWVERSVQPYRLKLANIRRALHPPVESEGKLSPLVLGVGGGLAELTHIVLFPGGICGAEFNFYGPRASALSYYFAVKLNNLCPGFKFNPLVRPDLDARLASLNDVKLLDMKVRASYASVIQDADNDLGAAFNAAINAVAAKPSDELELKFTRKKNKNIVSKAVPSALLNAIRQLAGNKNLRDEVSIFRVTGISNGEIRPFDILSEQFTAEKTVQPALNNLGGVDSESMFAAIEEAYGEVQSQLSNASELE